MIGYFWSIFKLYMKMRQINRRPDSAFGSRRSSIGSDKRGKSLTRSKSPFRSFRWKKSKPAADSVSGNFSDDEGGHDGRTVGRSRRWRNLAALVMEIAIWMVVSELFFFRVATKVIDFLLIYNLIKYAVY